MTDTEAHCTTYRYLTSRREAPISRLSRPQLLSLPCPFVSAHFLVVFPVRLIPSLSQTCKTHSHTSLPHLPLSAITPVQVNQTPQHHASKPSPSNIHPQGINVLLNWKPLNLQKIRRHQQLQTQLGRNLHIRHILEVSRFQVVVKVFCYFFHGYCTIPAQSLASTSRWGSHCLSPS